jgi:hypothetical protein
MATTRRAQFAFILITVTSLPPGATDSYRRLLLRHIDYHHESAAVFFDVVLGER